MSEKRIAPVVLEGVELKSGDRLTHIKFGDVEVRHSEEVGWHYLRFGYAGFDNDFENTRRPSATSQAVDKNYDTHVYALVRVKVLGTNGISQDPRVVADKIADAVAAASKQWMRPVYGSVKVNGASFDIEQVEFAQEVSWVKVNEKAQDGSCLEAEHNFDGLGEPMDSYPGCLTSTEGRLKADNEALKARVAALEAQLGSELLKPGAEPGAFVASENVESISIDFPGGINAHLIKTDEGVLVDLSATGASESAAGTSLHHNDAEGQFCEEHDIDIDNVAEWVGLHYGVNLEAESRTRRREWMDLYVESHEREESPGQKPQ